MDGINSARKQREPLEAKFADAWDKIEEKLLGYVLDERHRNDGCGTVTERDRIVAATVVQWLGTNVGQGFLGDVMGCNGDALDHFIYKAKRGTS